MPELMDYIIKIYNFCFYGIFIVEAILTVVFLILKGKTWAYRALECDYREAYKAKKDFFTVLIVFVGLIVFSVITYFVILNVFLRG